MKKNLNLRLNLLYGKGLVVQCVRILNEAYIFKPIKGTECSASNEEDVVYDSKVVE